MSRKSGAVRSRSANDSPRELYDPNCARCPRLASYLATSRARYPDYWSRPVGAFGDPEPRILIVGLAPGLHGANRSGRPFTGDYAGILLYETLHSLGLASQPTGAAADDGLKLISARITNAVKCAPPDNKPNPDEIRRCNTFLKAELTRLPSVRVLVALGRIAHDAVLMALELKRSEFVFGHGEEHDLGPPTEMSAKPTRTPAGRSVSRGPGAARYLIDSYHCSRYNTQTRRLTPEMFRTVLSRACALARLK